MEAMRCEECGICWHSAAALTLIESLMCPQCGGGLAVDAATEVALPVGIDCHAPVSTKARGTKAPLAGTRIVHIGRGTHRSFRPRRSEALSSN